MTALQKEELFESKVSKVVDRYVGYSATQLFGDYSKKS